MDSIYISIDKDFEEIAKLYLDEQIKTFDLVSNAIQNNDWEFVETIGHRTAGSAGSYEMLELGRIGVALEEAAQNKKIDYCRELSDKAQKYLKRVVFDFS